MALNHPESLMDGVLRKFSNKLHANKHRRIGADLSLFGDYLKVRHHFYVLQIDRCHEQKFGPAYVLEPEDASRT